MQGLFIFFTEDTYIALKFGIQVYYEIIYVMFNVGYDRVIFDRVMSHGLRKIPVNCTCCIFDMILISIPIIHNVSRSSVTFGTINDFLTGLSAMDLEKSNCYQFVSSQMLQLFAVLTVFIQFTAKKNHMKSLVVRMCKEYSPILYSLKNWYSACGSVLPSGIMVLRNLNLHCKQQQQITNGDQICENECYFMKLLCNIKGCDCNT